MRARWEQVQQHVKEALEAAPTPSEMDSIDRYCDYLVDLVQPAVEKGIPVARPLPCAKR